MRGDAREGSLLNEKKEAIKAHAIKHSFQRFPRELSPRIKGLRMEN